MATALKAVAKQMYETSGTAIRQAVTPPAEEPPARHATRINKRGVQTWLSPEAHRQLRIMAVQEDAQVQDLVLEALDLLFASRGKPRIARK